MKERTIKNWEEPFMSDEEAEDKIMQYLKTEFKAGNVKSDNLSIYLGLDKQVTFRQINMTIEKLIKAGVVRDVE